MIICVSGTPGTGKTTLAKRIAKDFSVKYLSGNQIISKYKLSEGKDNEKNCLIVDVKKFSKAAVKECISNKDYIIDSHLSHHIPSNNIDLCIICQCSLKILQQRLKKRRYSKKKIRENLDAEIFEICLNEAREKKHKIIVYDGKFEVIRRLLKEI